MQKDLEELAKRTWHRTQWGWLLNCHQGEETFTDINLLDLMRWNPRHKVLKTSKTDEKNKGTDWEWIIRHNGIWRRFAVQAKKVSKNGRYSALSHKVTGSGFAFSPLSMQQVDILDLYSKLTNAVPVYVLFNYDDTADLKTWHCQLNFDSEQLGCTVTDIHAIRSALSIRGGRSFRPVHRNGAVPWRCLVCNCLHRPALISSLMGHPDSEVSDSEVQHMLTTGEVTSATKILNLTAAEIVDTVSRLPRAEVVELVDGREFFQREGSDLVELVKSDPSRFLDDALFINNLKKILLPKYAVISDGDD